MPEQKQVCRSCGNKGSGKYCNSCGQPFGVKRLTVSGIWHEIFHFFTHLDKGFPYTLKKLITEPGKMQREYIAGSRQNHQKPFSMYFLCLSIAALSMYWVNYTLMHYFNSGDTHEGTFFDKYWVILQICLFPLFAFIPYLIFRRFNYNFAEIAVMMMYFFSFIFVLLIGIHLLRFIWPQLETRYIELPLFYLYAVATYINFFNTGKRLFVIISSMISITLAFVLAMWIQDLLVELFT